MSAPLVEFRDVNKRYGDVIAVAELNLTIEAGEFVALMGPSGCGKTTSLRMLAGLEAPTAGEVLIRGEVMNEVAAHERDTPMVWQTLALFPFLDVIGNVEFGLRMRGVDGDERRRRALEWLDRMGLAGYEKRRIDELSGGQRQRVALARSLVTEPEMLLLDEPLSALDAHLVIRMQGVLTRLQRELGITFVYVTHSQSEAFAMADRVVIMDTGHVAQIGPPREVYRAPANRFVAEFVGRNNLFNGTISPHADGLVTLASGVANLVAAAPALDRTRGSICVAADRMRLSSEEPDTASRIACTFISEEFAGAAVTVYLEAPDGTEIKVLLNETELAAIDLSPQVPVWVSFSPDAVHWLED